MHKCPWLESVKYPTFKSLYVINDIFLEHKHRHFPHFIATYVPQVYMCDNVCACGDMCDNVQWCVYVRVYVHVCMYMQVYVCVSVCEYVYVFVFVSVSVLCPV